MGFIRSINISIKKGTRKEPVESSIVKVTKQYGIEGDAHSGDWHRQISFLAWESILKAQAMGLTVKEGDFAENFTTEGIDLLSLPLGSQLRIGDMVCEISQIGKVCHTRCAIYHLAGDCIFPREGIFAVILEGGKVSVNDQVEILKIGNGTCEFTPAEAIAEIEAAKAAGTL